MKNAPIARCLAAAVVTLIGTSAHAEDVRPAYQPISPEYGYKPDNAALQKAVDERDRIAVREHGWRLWAGIMQPLETDPTWPLWLSWRTTYDAFESKNPPASTPHRGLRPVHATAGATPLPVSTGDVPDVNTPSPKYPVPTYVIDTFPGAVTKGDDGYSINDGLFFQSNGDIMIATESLSQGGYDAIRNEQLYLKDKLASLQAKGENVDLPRSYVSTKHMYWPVRADGLTPLPVWQSNLPDWFSGYAGYEVWNTLVAIDPTGNHEKSDELVEYLYGVQTPEGAPISPQRRHARVVDLQNFYHHKVTQKDWDMFTEADKAIITAASLWLYDEPFKVGDYLATVAMHVVTKEIPSWSFQSVWWSPTPDHGKYAKDRPQDLKAEGPWRHYLLTDSYDFPVDAEGDLEIAVNPYIEGVIHPIATNCRNCHVRAGYPSSPSATPHTSYQNAACPKLLTMLTPDNACFEGIALSDFAWIIPDRAK